MEIPEPDLQTPEILAPAGDSDCFLAALAAGANGIYLGLKNFSARMEARNFGLAELARLVELAHINSCRVYVAMNSLLKQTELPHAWRLVRRLATQVNPDGLIIQDLAMLAIARQAGFSGSIALSTLANVSDPAGLEQARLLGANRVILPRELSIDEMKSMGEACPAGLELECFVHGALCYCVSGRCYWSSYMGGKSGLRGRCVQPCRRIYSRQRNGSEAAKTTQRGERFFSCQDLELLPVIRALLSVAHLASWKIEGRKKGPHYVYHAVTAYKMLRDHGNDPQARKLAQEIMAMALGRPGVRARFLPQKKNQPMARQGQTSSGLLAGKISIQQDGSCIIKPHFELLPKDYLRVGVEDEKWHSTLTVSRHVPKGAALVLKLPRHKTPKAGVPVYLIDRREPELQKSLKEWHAKLADIPPIEVEDARGELNLPKGSQKKAGRDLLVLPGKQPGKRALQPNLGKRITEGLWLNQKSLAISPTMYSKVYFWLPPAIWPESEEVNLLLIQKLLRAGARQFVCNAPWQRGLFPEILPEDVDILAGPFCNLANSLALAEAAELGFTAAIVSPELPGGDLLGLPKLSPLPLGIVIGGFWPVGMSRFGLAGVDAGEMFFSPRGEGFWTLNRAGMSWIFPAWPLNLTQKRKELEAAGYSFFVWLEERPPKEVRQPERPGLFNWDNGLI